MEEETAIQPVGTPLARIFALLGGNGAAPGRDVADDQQQAIPRNFLAQIVAQSLSKSGDTLADPKIILPWLIGAVGAPTFFIGFLVPIRESLALLPQVFVGRVIRQVPVRKWFWTMSSIVEGACILAMGLIGLFGIRGATAGWAIVALLVVFATARGVASIASKDVLGKTVYKGLRGRVSGYAGTLSGIVASLVGLWLVLVPQAARPQWLLYAIIVAAGAAWFAAAAVYALVLEMPGATDDDRRGLRSMLRRQIGLLTGDRTFRKFILARGLMISTALAGPVYVALAEKGSNTSLAALGGLVLASGLANLVSSWLWGGLADRSSRTTMAVGGALCGLLGLVVLAALHLFPELRGSTAFFASAVFLLYVAHSGVRIGRKTQIVDMAGAETRTEYVALANTVIGILLLILGAVVGVLIALGLEIALLVLSLAALLASLLASRLPNVQSPEFGGDGQQARP